MVKLLVYFFCGNIHECDHQEVIAIFIGSVILMIKIRFRFFICRKKFHNGDLMLVVFFCAAQQKNKGWVFYVTF